MRRRQVSAAELHRVRSDLEATYSLVDYEIDAGPKMLRISAPVLKRSQLDRATERSKRESKGSVELLHGRDGLIPSPESSSRGAPHWGQLWPSAKAMASYFGHCVRMRSVDAVDVNCGLGVGGLGAAAKGARVRMADLNPEALRFAQYNALQNGFTHLTTMEFDWKLDRLDGYVGSLIFSDVLWSEDNFEHVFRMLRDNLTPGRTAFLAEPGRPVASGFLKALRDTDYRVRLDMERVEDVEDDTYYLVSILRIKKEE